jgi:hypothetical protein
MKSGFLIAGIVLLVLAALSFVASKFIFHPIYSKILKIIPVVFGLLGTIYLIVGLASKSNFTNVEEKDLKK